MKIQELLPATQAAYDDVQAKSAKRDKAAEALAAADKDLAAAQQTLTNLRAQLTDVLGQVLAPADPRFRKSA